MSGRPHARSSAPWFFDSRFWGDAGAVLFSRDRERAAEAEVGLIPQVLGVEPPGSVLDVFCGAGRHITPLVRAGYLAVGVDLTLEYLQEAFMAATEAQGPGTLEPRLFQARFDDLGAPRDLAEVVGAHLSLPHELLVDRTLVGPVDGAIWLGSSSGYRGPASDEALLRWIRSQLLPGGRILIEGSTLEDLQESPFEAWEWFEEVDESGAVAAVWRLRHQVTQDQAPQEAWFEGQWRRFSSGVSKELSFRYRVYTREAWAKMLQDAGYVNVRCDRELESLTMGEYGVSQPIEGLRPDHARSWIVATNPA